jgi:hypothetical protein
VEKSIHRKSSIMQRKNLLLFIESVGARPLTSRNSNSKGLLDTEFEREKCR